MSDYVTERMRRNLFVAAGLTVAAYSLQWAGTLHMAARATDAVGRLTLQAYELTAQEAAVLNIAGSSSVRWMVLLGQSAALYAVLFAAALALAWRFLPRRAASAAAAAGLFASYALALPFAPADLYVRAITGNSVWHYGLPSASPEAAAKEAPFAGNVP